MKIRTLFIFLAIILAVLLVIGCQKEEKRSASIENKDPIAKKAEIKKEGSKSEIERNKNSVYLTLTAQTLAGINNSGDPKFSPVLKRESFQKHSRKMASLWKINEKQRISKLNEWADKYLKDVDVENGIVFYPFGGPDCLYLTTLFPSAQTYYLIGLEPVGSVPDLIDVSEKEFNEILSNMHDALKPILQISFFRTIDMEEELKEPGVTPLIMTMLAGNGYEIIDVKPLLLKEDGTFIPSEWGKKETKVIEIDFVKTQSQNIQKLFYISQDISNEGIQKKNNFMNFLKILAPKATFLKAASYLLHKNHFSILRNYILDKSPVILQDDSGIPHKFFKQDAWDLKLFGTYQGPIKMFNDFYEVDLFSAYKNSRVEPLPFGIGYQHRTNSSNLLLAKKKNKNAN
jgi:hypothetical protein